MWEEAEEYLGALTQIALHPNAPGGEVVNVALVDAHNRCIEERRRAGSCSSCASGGPRGG
jgi:hypothetical protein